MFVIKAVYDKCSIKLTSYTAVMIRAVQQNLDLYYNLQEE